MISAGSLHAKVTILGALVKNLLLGLVLKVTGGARSGRPWLARVASEDLAPTPKDSWSYLEETSRCIGCGLCDIVAAGGEADGAGAAARPWTAGASISQWMFGAARRAQDAPLALDEAAVIEVLAARIARVCPAQVDPRAIVRLLRDRAAALVQSRGPGARR